jgi:hypothetical protein
MFYDADFRSSGRHSLISRDTIELMPIAALMSANVIESLGSNLYFTCDTLEQGM